MSPIKRPRFGGVFLFCPFEIQPRTSVCSAFCVVHAKFTTSDAKSFTGLCRSFSGYLPHFAPVIRLRILLCCTSCKALEDIQASPAPPPIPDTTATPDAAQDRAAAYYNNIYRGGMPVRPCYGSMPGGAAYRRPCQRRRAASPPVQSQPGGVSILLTPGGLQSGTGSTVRVHKASFAPSTRRAVRRQGRGGRRGTINGCRRISFSGFRPIANKGEQ